MKNASKRERFFIKSERRKKSAPRLHKTQHHVDDDMLFLEMAYFMGKNCNQFM